MATTVRRRIASVIGVVLVIGMVLAPPSAASAQNPPAPPGQDFVITPADLYYVWQQIEIAEAHAKRIAAGNPNASPLCSEHATFDDGLWVQTWFEPNGDPCVGSPLLPHGLRTVDGRWNNLHPGQTEYGAASQPFPRLLPPEFREAENVPMFAPTEPGQPTSPTTYEQTSGFVYDSQPRIASNLIADQTTDNPAAVAKLLQFLEEGLDAKLLDAEGNEVELPEPLPTVQEIMDNPGYDGLRIFHQNVATDEGLSAPFSSWMTIFGQFFDHGLDLVEKGDNGMIVVPLAPDDPLRDHPDFNPNAPFIMLTRATNQGDTRDHKNRTTPFIDQNQTYTSHPSHQVFLREYKMVDDAGVECETDFTGCRPVPTGALLDHEGGGLATWLDVKTQAAEKLGILLTDADVVRVPMVLTDPYGRFIPGENGFPQLIVDGTPNRIEGNPDAPVAAELAISAGHNFLDDIAHDAVPVDTGGDLLVRGSRDEFGALPPGTYDGDLLDAHYITGDGRGNENIGLTAAHFVFHAEHNRLLGQIQEVIDQDSADANSFFDLAERFEGEPGDYWDREERMFQAARFFNEMQYQHLAVEEFLRVVAPTMDAQPLNESAYHPGLNAAITAEFAHVVYRFGHSMLTETLPRIYSDRTTDEISLLDGFLNPAAFTKNGTLAPEEAAGSLIAGLARQVGNGIDEFVTDTLRNNLLGLPLDLATINMLRARDTGIPSLQSARRQFYAATHDPTLKPYANWDEFRLALKHRDSIVNFIAAYGKGDAALEAATTLEAKRARAAELAADQTYMTRPSTQTGLEDVDFWIGGLAEKTFVFGGMLGSTFNFVFESQAEKLQNGDRFYYLTRNQGQNFLAILEANSFTELIQRNTTATDLLPLDVMTHPDYVFDLEQLLTMDPVDWPDGLFQHPDGTVQFDDGVHAILYGTPNADRVTGGDGDDTIWGRAGDDTIEGGDGNDAIMGGDDDDVITDVFGDDTIMGGGGNDALRAGPGEDLVLAGSGNDFSSISKDDLNNNFTGVGNDIVLGGTGNDRIWGGEDDDWLEDGAGHDLVQGDNAIIWQNDPNGGHDVLIGGDGINDLDSDGGDDIIIGGPMTDRMEGMLGFDWVTYKGHTQPVVADMRFTVLIPPTLQGVRDRFDLVEGLSGWEGNDVLRGLTGIDDIPENNEGHDLTEAQLDRVHGLRQLLRPNDSHPNYACRFMSGADCGLPPVDSDGTSNIILGGGGSDIIEGRAGDDFIDGDVWLDVQLRWNRPGTDLFFDSAAEIADRIIAREINPSDLSIHRSIKPPSNTDGIDTAVYTNSAAEYSVRYNGDGYWEIFHDGAAELEESDGRDILRNMEMLEFPDGCVPLSQTLQLQATGIFVDVENLTSTCGTYGTIVLSTQSPAENVPMTAEVFYSDEVTNPTNVVWEWQFAEEGEEWEPSFNPSTEEGNVSTYVPNDPDPGNILRAVVTFDDDNGIRRSIASLPTANAVTNVNDAPVGPRIVPAQPYVNSLLTAVDLSDEDGIESLVEDLLVNYRWERETDGGWETITSTGVEPYYRTTAADIGARIRVVAEYDDDQGTSEQATSAPTEPVLATMPNRPATGAPVIFGEARVNETMVADTDGIADPDGIPADAFEYQWQSSPDGIDWDDIDSETGEMFQPTPDHEGLRLRVRVAFVDARGFNEALYSDPTESAVGPADPPPTQPTGLQAVAAADGPVALSWNANSEPDLAGYKLFRSSVPGFDSTAMGLLLYEGSDTSFVDTSGNAGQTYYYTVRAYDAGGNESPQSTHASATVAPNEVPVAQDVSVSTNAGTPVQITLLATDADGDDLTFTSTTPANGTLDTAIGDTVVYTPNPGFTGVDSFTYTAGDGRSESAPATVTITITAAESIPTTLDASPSNASHPIGEQDCTTLSLFDQNGDPMAGVVISVMRTGANPGTATVTTGVTGTAQYCYSGATAGVDQVTFTAGQATDTASRTWTGEAQQPPDPPITPELDAATSYAPMAPVRLFDTRPGEPGAGPKGLVGPEASIDVQVAGVLDIPDDAVAVALNITATGTTGPGFITVHPTGQPRPLASVLNISGAGQTRATMVTVPIGQDGKVTFYSHGGAHLLADVAGFYSDADAAVSAGRLVPMTPERLFDTREGEAAPGPKGKLAAGQSIDVQVLGVGSVPATGVSAVMINITGTDATDAGFITAFPTGEPMPLASTLNLSFPGDTAPNLAMVPVGAGGKITIFSSHGAHVLGDVTGYITDGSASSSTDGLFVPITPSRMFDTREGEAAPGPKGFVPAGGSIDVQIAGVFPVASNATAVMVNVAAVDAPPGFVTVWPTGLPQPLTSVVNLAAVPTDTRANAAIVGLGDGGRISLFTSGGAHLLADATGYFLGS